MRSLRPIGPTALVVTGLVALAAGDLPRIVRYAPLLVSILVLGLPHGAVDHVAVAGVLERSDATGHEPRRRALRTIAVLYLVAGGGYLLVWFAAPVAAAVAFLLLTWGHWGQGDLYHLLASGNGAHLDARGKRLLTATVRGGIPMLVPLLAFPEVYRRVLTALADVFVAVPSVPAWPFAVQTRLLLGSGFAAVTLGALAWERAGVESGTARIAWRVDAGETVLLWAFFLLVPPILAIGVYFALWHSLRHVRRVLALADGERAPFGKPTGIGRLAASFDGDGLTRFALDAGPNTVGALVVLGGIYAVGVSRGGLSTVVAVYLVTLAVLTLPHTVVVTWLDRRQGVWTIGDA